MLYNFSANVFNERLSSEFGITTTITVIANNEEDAYNQAKISFDKYIHVLYKHHNIAGNGKVRKTINTFNYNNLKMI